MGKTQGVANCQVIRVIRTGEGIGSGTPEDPARGIYKLWTMDGELICVIDPQGGYVTEQPSVLLNCD